MIEDATSFRGKDQVLFDLAKALQFSPESLDANRQGRLSGDQFRQFIGRCLQPAVLTVICAIAPFLVWTSITGMAQQLSYPAAFSLLISQLMNFSDFVEAHGKFGAASVVASLVVGLGLAVFFATRISPALYFDLLDGKVKAIEGRVVAREEQLMRPNGRDPIEKYFFALKTYTFPVSFAAFRAIENGSVYLVYLMPRSDVMVSMEPKISK